MKSPADRLKEAMLCRAPELRKVRSSIGRVARLPGGLSGFVHGIVFSVLGVNPGKYWELFDGRGRVVVSVSAWAGGSTIVASPSGERFVVYEEFDCEDGVATGKAATFGTPEEAIDELMRRVRDRAGCI